MSKQKVLTKDQILAKNEELVKVQFVDVPEWGGTVGIRVMSQAERDQFDQSLISQSKVTTEKGKPKAADVKLDGMKAMLISLTLCNEDGHRMFTKEEVQAMPSSPIERLHDKCQEINGMTEADVKDKVKN